jgi:hypothetical protein
MVVVKTQAHRERESRDADIRLRVATGDSRSCE